MKPWQYLPHFLYYLFLFVGIANAQQFEVSSVVSYKPGEVAGIKLKGAWKPSKALSVEDTKQPQVIVFLARDKKKPEQRLKLAAASFPTPPDDEAFRNAAAQQLEISRKFFGRDAESPHYVTLIYNPGTTSGSGPTAAAITEAQPCLVAEETLQTTFGDEKGKTVIWIDAALDARGGLQSVSIDSNEVNVDPLREAIERTLKLWKFSPALENGVGVASRIRFPLPFVVGWAPPKPFDEKQEYWLALTAVSENFRALDRLPRLVSLCPVKPASLPRLSGTAGFDMLKPLVEFPIVVNVTITPTGVLNITPVFERQWRVAKTLSEVFSGWRFAPPARGGKPCSIDFVATVSLLPRSALEGSAPKPLFSVAPEYPKEYYELVDESVLLPSDGFGLLTAHRFPLKAESEWINRSQKLTAAEQTVDLRDQENKAKNVVPGVVHRGHDYARLHGAVEMAVMVDINGEVSRAEITNSKSPVFDVPAMWSIYARKYLPLADGKGSRQLAEKIEFGRGYGGPTVWSFELRLPANAKLDSPIALSRVAPPIFPRTVPASVTSGRAVADIHVDEHGRVTGIDLIEASEQEFGLALRAALEASQFVPLVYGGKPVAAVIRRAEVFDRKDKIRDSLVLVRDSEDRQFVTAQELDRPLAVISMQNAVFPLNLIGREQHGEAVVEMVINKSGQVCEPAIVSSNKPEFGFAAVQAVSCWGFAPPTKHGSPVSVKVRTTLRFNTPAAVPSS